MSAPPTISWLTLLSADPELSVTFYRAMFGWQAVPLADGGGLVVSARDGVSVGFFRGLEHDLPGSAEPRREGGWVPYFWMADPAPALAAAVSAAASGGNSWLALDNGGARFGVTTEPARLPGARAHVELATPNVDRAVAFYGALIDVKFDRVIGDDMDFVAMSRDNGGEPVGGIIDVGDLHRSQARPQWVPYFSATDVDAEAARALELGALLRIPPANSPLDRYAVLADPTGAMFGLSNAQYEEWPSHARFTEYPLSRQP